MRGARGAGRGRVTRTAFLLATVPTTLQRAQTRSEGRVASLWRSPRASRRRSISSSIPNSAQLPLNRRFAALVVLAHAVRAFGAAKRPPAKDAPVARCKLSGVELCHRPARGGDNHLLRRRGTRSKQGAHDVEVSAARGEVKRQHTIPSLLRIRDRAITCHAFELCGVPLARMQRQCPGSDGGE